MSDEQLRKDIKNLIKVVDANQRFIGNLMERVEELEKKGEEKKKSDVSYIQ